MLWLITQNKQSVANVKEVTVNGKYIEGVMDRGFLNEWSKTLGKYESNERALEVLGEIFMKIEENKGVSVTYTMPKK